MAKYQQAVQTLLDEIGGKANIQAVSHCMTRMRFVLVDPKKANEKAIEAIPCVKGTFTQAGQYQVIIGNDVATFYQEFTKYAGIEGVSRDAVKSAAKTNQNPVQRVVGALGEIFAPIIPALICGGLILGFRNLIGEVNLLNDGTQSLADVSQFWAGLYNFLWLIGEAIFHFLPVGITWSITKKMGTTQILGIVLGLTLISPQLLNGFSVATTAAEDIPVWDFGFAQVQMIGYQGQVIAAILAGFVLVYLEKFFQKICPEVIRMVVVPFCALVPAVLIAHTVVGPIGWKIGDFIANIVNMGLASNVKLLFAALFGLLYAPIVMTGLHHMTNAGFTSLDQYRDVESINHYHILRARGLHEDSVYDILRVHSRDNSRTPMQWDDSAQGGFTSGTPWLSVNPNTKTINAESQIDDPDSIFNHYRKLIALRKQYDVISAGDFAPLDQKNPSVLAYTRTLDGQQIVVVNNFYRTETDWTCPVDLTGFTCLLSNYPDTQVQTKLHLRPYESVILYRG